jgi:hypothetical protein
LVSEEDTARSAVREASGIAGRGWWRLVNRRVEMRAKISASQGSWPAREVASFVVPKKIVGLTRIVRVPVVAMVLAGAATVGVGGYAAYQHYNCGSFLGNQTAAQVLHQAAQRMHNASFKLTYKTGDGYESHGELDTHNRVGDMNETVGGTSAYTGMFEDEVVPRGAIVSEIFYHDSLYYTTSAHPTWASGNIEEGDPFEDPGLLSLARDVTQSHCDFHGTMDATRVQGTSGPPLPFEASINPDGYPIHEKITTPSQGFLDWTFFDYGVRVVVTPPV